MIRQTETFIRAQLNLKYSPDQPKNYDFDPQEKMLWIIPKIDSCHLRNINQTFNFDRTI